MGKEEVFTILLQNDTINDTIKTSDNTESLYFKYEIFHNKSKQFLKDTECFACIKLCYEIIHGCLSADNDFGSTEIFPEGFVEDVWQTYLKALKKGKFTAGEIFHEVQLSYEMCIKI